MCHSDLCLPNTLALSSVEGNSLPAQQDSSPLLLLYHWVLLSLVLSFLWHEKPESIMFPKFRRHVSSFSVVLLAPQLAWLKMTGKHPPAPVIGCISQEADWVYCVVSFLRSTCGISTCGRGTMEAGGQWETYRGRGTQWQLQPSLQAVLKLWYLLKWSQGDSFFIQPHGSVTEHGPPREGMWP